MSVQIIFSPKHHTRETLALEQGSALRFDFDPDSAAFERVGNDLAIEFDNGSTVVVDNFFVVDEGDSLPSITLANGVHVESDTFLQSMNPDMDLTIAAGTNPTVNSSGVNEYGDAAGELLGGVDSLGAGAGPLLWNRSTREQEHVDIESAPAVALSGDNSPLQPLDPPPTDTGLHSNIFIGQANGPLHVGLTNVDETKLTDKNDVSFSFKDGVSQHYKINGFNPDTGLLQIELTEAGKEALANGALSKEIITVTVDGKSYELLLHGSDNKSHTDSQDADFGNMLSEWYVVNGALKSADINVSSHDGLKQHVRIEGTETDEISRGDEVDQITEQHLPGEQVLGTIAVTNSKINAGSRGEVDIIASNQRGEIGTGEAFAAGVYGSGNDDTSITAGRVNIEATADFAYSGYRLNQGAKPETSSLDYALAYGVKTNASDVKITANQISITSNLVYNDNSNPHLQTLYEASKAVGVSVGGEAFFGREGEDGLTPEYGSLALRGTEGNDTIHIEGHVEKSAEAPIGGFYHSKPGINATGVEVLYGDLSIDTGEGNDIISIIASISDSIIGDNGDLTALLGNDMYDPLDPTAEPANIEINGGEGHDTLNLITRFHNKGTTTASNANGLLTGVDTWITNIEEINILNEGDFFKEGAGINSKADVQIDNSGSIDLTIAGFVNGILAEIGDDLDKTGVGSIVTEESQSKVLIEADTLKANIDAYDIGLHLKGNSYKDAFDDNIFLQSEITLEAHKALTLVVTGGGNKTSPDSEGPDCYAVNNDGGKLNIFGGSEDDSITFNGGVLTNPWGGTTIYTGEGNDEIIFNGDVTTQGAYDDNAGRLNIDVGNGTNTITVNGSLQSVDTDAMTQIFGGNQNDELRITDKLIADHGGIVDISLGQGNDKVTISGGIYEDNKENEGRIIIDLGDGAKNSIETSMIVGDVILKAGSGYDTLIYKPAGNEHTQHTALKALSDFLKNDNLSGFEEIVVDLTASTSTGAFDLDFFSNIPQGVTCYIKGNADDYYTLDDTWTAGAMDTNGFIPYTKMGVTIYVHQDISSTSPINTHPGGTEGNDDITIDGTLTKGIDLKGGDDKLTIKGDLDQYTLIKSTGGTDAITIEGALAKGGKILTSGNATIDIGRGMENATIEAHGNNKIDLNVTGSVSDSTIKTSYSATDDDVTISGNLLRSSIDMGDGKNSLTITGDSIGDRSSSENYITMGIGDDEVTIKGNAVRSSIDLGYGNNTLDIGRNIENSKVTAYDGDDNMTIGGSVKDSDISLGDGQNSLTIKGDLHKGTNISSTGKTTITIEGDVRLDWVTSNEIYTGSADDELTIEGTWHSGKISLGSGNNKVDIFQVGKELSPFNKTELVTYEGDDIIKIGDAYTKLGIDAGTGSNSIIMGDTHAGFDIKTSSNYGAVDQNSITIKSATSGTITTGDSDDTIVIGQLNGDAHINVGSGTNSVSVTTGSGDDTIYLSGDLDHLSIVNTGGNDTLHYTVDWDSEEGVLEKFIALLNNPTSNVSHMSQVFLDLEHVYGSEGDEFNLDTLLETSVTSTVYIDGEGSNLIDTGSWTQAGEELYNGYYMYTNSETDLQVFIQQNIVINAS